MHTRFLYRLIAAAFLCLASPAFAQVVVTGTVTDAQTGNPLFRANIQLVGTQRGSVANREGEYRLRFNYDHPQWVRFSYLGYDADSVLIAPSDTLIERTVNIALSRSTQELEGVTIFSESKPEEVFGTVDFSVGDFAFADDDKLVLLAYDKGLDKDPRIVLSDRDQKVLFDFTLPGSADELFRDFQGHLNILCPKSVYRVEHKSGSNSLRLYALPPVDFYTQLYPGVDTLNGHILWSDFRWRYPQFNYYGYDAMDTTNELLATIKDDLMMRMYRSEYVLLSSRDKLMARKTAIANGTDKYTVAAEMTGFPQSIYYTPVYAPMFVVNDAVLIFDHYKNYIYKFNQNMDVVDSVAIAYHNEKSYGKWKQKVIQDQITGKLYAQFEQKGHPQLRKIDISTGKAEHAIGLTHKYVERIRIKNEYVYYIYRPSSASGHSRQQKFIYRELIR